MGNFRKVWYDRCVKIGLGKWETVVDLATNQPLLNRPRGTPSKGKPKLINRGMIFHDHGCSEFSACRRTEKSGDDDHRA